MGTISGGYRWIPNVSCIQNVCTISSQLVLSTRAPPGQKHFPSSRICPECRGGYEAEGVRGAWQVRSPWCVSPNSKQTHPSMTWCGSGCIGSLANVCALDRIYLPVVWVLCYGCLEKSYAVCFIWDPGPWFLRVLRNIQPHPLIVKGGFTSVLWGMFPAFTRQQSLDMCFSTSKQLSKEYLSVLSKAHENDAKTPIIWGFATLPLGGANSHRLVTSSLAAEL